MDPRGWVAGVVALVEKEKRKDEGKSNKLEHSCNNFDIKSFFLFFFVSILCGSEYNECKVLQKID